MNTVHTLGPIAEGAVGFALAAWVKSHKNTAIFIAEEEADLNRLQNEIGFYLPEQFCAVFAPWDVLPYDRSSVHPSLMMERLRSLWMLGQQKAPSIILTTMRALSQYVMPPAVLADYSITLRPGHPYPREKILELLQEGGYIRAATVNEPGEYAVRGSIIDLMLPGEKMGYRLDFFGQTCDTIRMFNPSTQMSGSTIEHITIFPASEVILNAQTITVFQQHYCQAFGVPRGVDPLYEAIIEGHRHNGIEHWLPYFYEEKATLFHYLPKPASASNSIKLSFLSRTELTAMLSRWLQEVEASYQIRIELAADASNNKEVIYRAIPPAQMWLTHEHWQGYLANAEQVVLSRFASCNDLEVDGSTIRPLLIDASTALDVMQKQLAHQSVIIAIENEASKERVQQLLEHHGFKPVHTASMAEVERYGQKRLFIAKLPIMQGFTTDQYGFVSEQEVLGKRSSHKPAARRKLKHLMQELASLVPGECVVHRQHGVGRFEGLKTITVNAIPHDCVSLVYEGGDKLYIPVENIDDISKFGSEDATKLDRLGGAAWQERKARLKQRITMVAHQLLNIAALRLTQSAPILAAPAEIYEAFVARFTYVETEDQAEAIADVLQDLAQGTPMDRLICGDVGFGKTEVALRAACNGIFEQHPDGTSTRRQVAVVVPTTLLCRQHYATFLERFSGLVNHYGIRIRQLSRLVSPKEAELIRKQLASGEIDIVIGTHALLAKSIQFHNLGLLIIDEEQHFGVTQKERLKELKSNIHVLTLSATPIPRTMQMAISGMRDLSLITTPPLHRLAVRTRVLPYDPVVVRDAVLREKARGGRVFYVTPYIKDIEELKEQLSALLPECKIVVAHGQLPVQTLDKIINAFYDGMYDILLATNIIESGLDVPGANTIVIHRSDRFGLSQLYQLRGRVGRGTLQAYAYLTTPAESTLSPTAAKRLEVMQSLDSLGAGFSLASHDMDIRGYGNLLGDEQSGHIKEVGVELYQEMLEEAIAAVKAAATGEAVKETIEESWNPEVNLGLSVLIPEQYVSDISLRIGLYRRIGDLRTEEELEDFTREMRDRFGALPEETEHLLAIIRIKQLCKKAGIIKLDAGPKAMLLKFHPTESLDPAKIMEYLSRHSQTAKMRDAYSLVITTHSENKKKRVELVIRVLSTLLG